MQYKPNQALILGLDAARARSGYSIWAANRYLESGSVTEPEERDQVVDQAIWLSEDYQLPFIVGAEYWTLGMLSYKTYIGIGIGWGYWDDIFTRIGFPKRRILKVKPNEWCRPILGVKVTKYNREARKQAAINYCRMYIWKSNEDIEDHDSAEATIISKFFVYSSKVAELIKNPNRLKKVEFRR